MKDTRRALRVVLTVLCAVTSGAGSGTRGIQGDKAIAIANVSIIPMDSERLLLRQTVVTRDGLIAEVGPAAAVQVPADARRIDGTGMYLMPGLIDAHMHLRDPSELLSYLAYGVTSIVSLGGPSGNVPDVFTLAARVERGDVVGPRIFSSGRILDGDPPVFPSVSRVVRTPAEARSLVQAQLTAGASLIKVYNNLGGDELQAVTREAQGRGVTVWGHIPRIEGRATALQQALAAGLDVIAHGEEVFFTMLYRDVERQLDRGLAPTVDVDLVRDAVRAIQQARVAVIPNLSFVAITRAWLDDADHVWADPEAQFLHPAVRRMWQQQNPTSRPDLKRFDLRERGKQVVVRQLTRALSTAGVPLFVGTDASAAGLYPGRSAHLELAELVDAGLTPFEALSAGTRTPGRFLAEHVARSRPMGTLTTGSQADLVLLGANPLIDVSNAARITGVIVRGRWYSHGEITRMRVAH